VIKFACSILALILGLEVFVHLSPSFAGCFASFQTLPKDHPMAIWFEWAQQMHTAKPSQSRI
jgi:hypothetical protein